MRDEQEAIDTVATFLRLVEERRLEEASSYLSAGIEILFPGGRRFRDLHEQVASSASRLRTVRKIFEQFDALERDGSWVVYAMGTLQGEDLEGAPFSGVRFVDRFVLRNGKIDDHKVWNDLAESGVV